MKSVVNQIKSDSYTNPRKRRLLPLHPWPATLAKAGAFAYKDL